MVVQDATICHCEKYWNIHFFVKDKFTEDLQSFVMPDFTFLSIKIVHYFSCVLWNVSLPDSFTKINPLLQRSQQQNYFSNICNFFFTHLHVIIITQFCIWDLLKLLYRAVNSNQLLIHSFLFSVFPRYFLLPCLALWFSVSVSSGVYVRILLFPYFLPPVFLGPALGNRLITSRYTLGNGHIMSGYTLGNGHIMSGYTLGNGHITSGYTLRNGHITSRYTLGNGHITSKYTGTNAVDVPSSLLSWQLEGALAGSVTWQ